MLTAEPSSEQASGPRKSAANAATSSPGKQGAIWQDQATPESAIRANACSRDKEGILLVLENVLLVIAHVTLESDVSVTSMYSCAIRVADQRQQQLTEPLKWSNQETLAALRSVHWQKHVPHQAGLYASHRYQIQPHGCYGSHLASGAQQSTPAV